ncbi:MAG TPA: flavodoxin family protein, partial [Ramlibacter sp.]|nr:flavodoxin family protein [Ramlibacter sp.]
MAQDPTDVRKGQAPDPHPRDVFRQRFLEQFFDPAYRAEQAALDRLEAIAWDAYQEGRKAPVTRKAGPGFADPDYDLSVEWYETRQKLQTAQARWGDPATPSRVLVIACGARNDGSCPGEMSKTFRLAKIAQEVLDAGVAETDFLDLSLLTSDYRRHIHPCKACVSTAMPLCHWPCSCYPNHATGQVGDWMNEIYERWVAAHGVLLVTPTHWYQTSSPLKLMMDRLVCADGGNPDPTSTGGKNAAKAKELELAGWPYPQHLAGRTYGVVVHGDVAGIEGTRRNTCDWLDWMGLIDAGPGARLDRYIGYYEPYATSHQALDRDDAVQEEVRNVARALAKAVAELRQGRLSA